MEIQLFEKKIITYDEYVKIDELFKFPSKGKTSDKMKNITTNAINEINNFTFGRLFFQIDKHGTDEDDLNKMISVIHHAEQKLHNVKTLLPDLFDVHKNNITPIKFDMYQGKLIDGYIPSEWVIYLDNNGIVDSNMAREKLKAKIFEITI